MSGAWRIWAVAGGLSLLAHGALFAMMADGDASQEERSAGAPTAVWGVAASSMVDELQPADPITGAVEPTAEEATEGEEEVKPVEQAQAVEHSASETPEATTPAAVQTTPAAESPAETQAEVAPLTEVAPMAVPDVELEEVEANEEKVTITATEPSPAPAPAKRKKRQQSAASGGAVGQQAGDGGRRTDTAGRADISSYLGRIGAHLRRYKRHPAGGLHGTVRVTFVIAANGAVQGVSISRSSGSSVLDSEALAMVRRASPFPPFPSNVRRSTMSYTVPITFTR